MTGGQKNVPEEEASSKELRPRRTWSESIEMQREFMAWRERLAKANGIQQ